MSRKAPSEARSSDKLVCIFLTVVVFCYCLTDTASRQVKASLVPHSSDIDWCENNYAHTELLAEFWNSMSSLCGLPMAFFVGVMVMSKGSLSHKSLIDYRPFFYWLLFSLAFIGLGSFYFHAQLSLMGQIFDEVTICWANFFAMSRSLPRVWYEEKLGIRMAALLHTWHFLLSFMFITPLLGLFLPMVSHLITIGTLPGVICTTSIAYRQLPPERAKVSYYAFRRALVSAIAAFVCWTTDQVGCDAVQIMLGFNPQLHAWWHVLIFLAAYHTQVFLFFVIVEMDKDIQTQHRIKPILCGTMETWEIV